MFNLFKEQKEAGIFERNLKNKKADLEFNEIINSLNKLNAAIDYRPDTERLIREINILSRIKRAPLKNRPFFLAKPFKLAISASIILILAGSIFYSTIYYKTPTNTVNFSQNAILNEANSIALDGYIAKQKSNDALATEIDNAFNSIPNIPQNNKPFIYW